MATLSKTAIYGIAKKMTEKSKKHSEQMEEEYEQLATDIYEASIPDEIKKCFKKYPDYIETTMEVFADGNGFNRETISLTKRLPGVSSWNVPLPLTAANAAKLVTAKRKSEKAKEDYENLLQETESALFALKTPKNISENLEEAAPFLPPPMSNSLVVNFESLKKRLRKQPESKKEVAV